MGEDFYFFTKGTLILKPPRRSSLTLRILLVTIIMCSVYMSTICFKQIKIPIKAESLRPKLREEHPYDHSIASWKQTKIPVKQSLLTTKPVEQHSYDHDIVGLPQESRIEPESMKTGEMKQQPEILSIKAVELPRFKPLQEQIYHPGLANLEQTETTANAELMVLMKPAVKQRSYERRTAGLTQEDIKIRPELARREPVQQLVRSKQTRTTIRPESLTVRGIKQRPNDPRIVSLKQSKVHMKPESIVRSSQAKSGRYTRPSFTTKSQFNQEILRNQSIEPTCQKPDIPDSELPYVHYPIPTTYSRRECACTPVRFYVIVSMQRSGSKWLESLLNSHVNISANGEVFIDRERIANVSAITKTLDKVFNLDWRNSGNKKGCVAAVGFKWMLNQGIMGYHEQVSRYFVRRGVSVIFLFRRNLLRRLISLLANSQDHKSLNETHKAHVFTQQEAQALASYRPSLNPKSLVRKLKRAASRATEAIDHFKSIRHMVLYYEDLVKNSTKLSDVIEFLRVPKRDLKSRHVKIHTKPLSEMVRNWSSVRKALKGSQFESFLESDYQM